MNWRKFIAECRELKNWLHSQGHRDPDRIVLQALILMGRKQWPPDKIITAAATLPSLPACSLAAEKAFAADMQVPASITGLLARWIRELPCGERFLGEAYERLAVGRRSQGLYYTAPEIIDFIIRHTVEAGDLIDNPYIKVLDPACGSGYFLLKAYDVLQDKYRRNRGLLRARYPELDWSDAGIHRHIVTCNLWGADINPVAVELAQACLLLKDPENSENLQLNFLAGDSLIRPEDDSPKAERAFWRQEFDYVIGNPPYVSFGLRGVKRLEPGYEKYLRRSFSASAQYKLSYYALFLERGIGLLAAGGRLGFIVPDSFLLGRYYSKIRRYILDQTAIEAIAHIAGPAFKRAVVGMSAICILTKEPDQAIRSNQQVTIYQAGEKTGLLQGVVPVSYNQGYFASLPYDRFRLFSDLTVKNLVDKIDISSFRLANFASGHSGIRSRTRQSEIVAQSPGGECWRRGLISGSQVQRYRLEYRGHWLNIDSGRLYKGGWDPAIVNRRKILVRQTGYDLTACIDNDRLYHLNNVHSFIAADGFASLDYLLLLLNSRLLSFYYHAVSLEYGRAMAQTDIDTLELLPVRFDAGTDREAPGLVAAMQALVARQAAGEADLTADIAELNCFFDQLVYRLYDLTDKEIDCIEHYEASLNGRRKNSR